MLRSMTTKQFLKWEMYESIEAFGERRADLRAASIVRAIWNVNRDTKTYPDPIKLVNFVGEFLQQLDELEGPRRKQTVNDQKTIARAIVAAFAESSRSKKKRE